jgi:AcrR family transcriptional regulator
MRARAASAAATRERILRQTMDLFKTRFRSEIRLEDIATAAGVTVQTVLNVSGTRDALINAAIDQLKLEVSAQRTRAAPGDVKGVIADLFDEYEQFGDMIVRMLAENADPEWADNGRAWHRQMTRRQFAPQLAGVTGAKRRRLLDALVCACDVYLWKLLRRDLGRSRAQAEAIIRTMVQALVEDG